MGLIVEECQDEICGRAEWCVKTGDGELIEQLPNSTALKEWLRRRKTRTGDDAQ